MKGPVQFVQESFLPPPPPFPTISAVLVPCVTLGGSNPCEEWGVETVPEEDEHADGIASLAKEVAQLLRDTIKLNVKMQSLDGTSSCVRVRGGGGGVAHVACPHGDGALVGARTRGGSTGRWAELHAVVHGDAANERMVGSTSLVPIPMVCFHAEVAAAVTASQRSSSSSSSSNTAPAACFLHAHIAVRTRVQAVEEERLSPKELDSLGPKELSYWVASFFQDVKLLQQNLLEEDSTLKRLKKEKDILAETVKYYSAAAALKGAFSSDTEGGGGGTGGGDDPTKKKNSGKDAASDA
eukprot:366029-Chlamydomonas_euryale.AAC.38